MVRAQLFGTAAVPGVPAARPAAERELDEATRLDPNNVEVAARRLIGPLARRDPAGWAPEIQRIAAAHPQDWRAWLLVGLTAPDAATRRAATARGLALNPDQPALMTVLAAADVGDRRFDEGLLLATRAMSFRQNLWPAALQAMRAQAGLGHCPEAAALFDVTQRRGPASMRQVSQEVWRRSGCR